MSDRRRLKLGIAAGVAALTAVGATVGAIPAQASAPSAGESIRIGGGERYAASIWRTEYGIPHVTGADIGSAGYGYGYAFAQDNLCALAQQVMTLRGERSLYLGPDGPVEGLPGQVKNIDSDVYYRASNESGELERLLAQPTPKGPSMEARRLVAGYAAGFNRYLRDTGRSKLPDPTCRGKDWVRPVTEIDLWRNMRDVSQLFGVRSLVTAIATAKPPVPGVRLAGGPAPGPQQESMTGSNAWALGSEVTTDGSGMVLGNPHLPWTGPLRMYQVQLTVPDSLNVAGAGLYGTPVVMIGHNSTLAWSHTTSTAQRSTQFQLALKPGQPTSYLVDGKPEAMSTQRVRVTIRGGDGKLSTVERTVYRSRYGPVLSTGWTNQTAFAVRDANANNVRSIDQWLGMGRARNVDELSQTQQKHQGIPWNNTFAADSTGRTRFADAEVVPHVTDARAARCVDTPEGRALYPALTILNGSRSTCNWGSDPDALEPGIFGPGRHPQQIRRDYVASSNDTPWLTNASAPLTGYPRIYGSVKQQRSLRDRLSHDMIVKRRAGSDGFGAPGFTLDTLRATMLDNRNLSAELLRDQLVALCQTNPRLPATDGTPVDVRSACGVLARWDLRGNSASRGAVLWREFWLKAGQVTDLYRVPFNPATPLTTPNTLNSASRGVRSALADAVARMNASKQPLDLPLGHAQRFASASGPIPVHGCPGQEGCFNVIGTGSPQLGPDGAYPDVASGSSFLMAVHLAPTGPRTRTIMTYSQSANPASPHHRDQAELYSRKGWVTERFTSAEIAAAPSMRTTIVRE